MLNKQLFYFCLYLITTGISGLCYGQNSISKIKEIESLYRELKYEEALTKGNQILQSPQSFNSNDLAFVHKYLGVIYFSTGRRDSSQFHFLSYLNLKPEGTLDSVNFSPKIIEFFENIKNNNQPDYNEVKSEPFSQYIFIDDRRPGAAWRSVIIPGWGQFYKNQRSRGIVIGSSFLGSAILTGTAFYLEDKYHQEYRNSQTQSEINANYDKYNNWYKIRRSFTWITASIWLLNIADAIWAPYPQAEITISPTTPASLALKLYIN